MSEHGGHVPEQPRDPRDRTPAVSPPAPIDAEPLGEPATPHEPPAPFVASPSSDPFTDPPVPPVFAPPTPSTPPPSTPPPSTPLPSTPLPSTPLSSASIPGASTPSPLIEPPKTSRAGLIVGLVMVVALGAVALLAMIGGAWGNGDDAVVTATSVPVATTAGAIDPSTTLPPPDTSVGADGGLATVAQLARSTVQILLLDNGRPTCSGSGTIVESDGTILTNAHVLDPSDGCTYDTIGIAITDDAGRPPELSFSAQVFAYDPVLDLAVVRVVADMDGNPPSVSFPAVTIGNSDDVQIGDPIRILGYPGIGGETVTFTNGVVSGFTSQNNVGDRSWIKTDATIAGGNSGGAALDAAGHLIGVPTQAAASATGPIVDCRVITDTNGDGRFDDDDQCVPIGGFLNGIRPVNLAVDVLAEAVNASPFSIDENSAPSAPVGFDPGAVRTYNPAWSLGASDDEDFVPDFVVTATAGIEALCIWFDWEGIPDGVIWDGLWLVDGKVNDAYSFVGEAWDLGLDGFDNWICAIDEVGLAGGVYEFVFFTEDEVQFYESIRLTETPAPLHDLTFANRTGAAICFVFVAPLGASDTGLDELGVDSVLADGDDFVLAVPEGDIVFDVYDCDLGLVLSNYDGITIDGERTIELS